MKKLIVLLSLLIGFACEDDKEDDSVNFDGTYKLSSKTWSIDCDGFEDVWYWAISGNTITETDYMGDECDDDEDCYDQSTFTLSGGKDGVYDLPDDFGDGPDSLSAGDWTLTLKLNGKELSATIKLSGSDGSFTQYWDKISDEIKTTYSPMCTDSRYSKTRYFMHQLRNQ